MLSAFSFGTFPAFRSAVVYLVFYSVVVFPSAALATNSATLADNSAVSNERRAIQALSRLTFGARPGDLERVKKIGVDAFIAGQLAPDNIDDSKLSKLLDKLPTLNLWTPTIAEQYNPPKPPPTPTPAASPAATAVAETAEMKPSPTPAAKPTPVPKNPGMVVTELQRAKLLRAVYSNRQLYEVMVDFWENHFSIYANKDANRWLLTSFDRDSVRPFAMTRFRDLLGATAKSPAMLYYLDNWQSSVLREYQATKDKPARRSGGINENYARELMELHTLGVDGGYTQKDVQEVARCFTGWTIRKPNEEGIFVYNPAMHDNGEKVVLGVKIPAGGGIADGERVLDILAKHPATARFIATKMARRFLGDAPPAAVVARAAKVFLSTDGSITETLRSIVTSPAFFSTAAFRTKIKSPFEFVASALRITNAETDAGRPILDWIAKMGQPVYGRITPDGYPDFTTEWLSNNDLIARFNFASALAMNTIKGTSLKPEAFLLESTDGKKVPDVVAQTILLGQASAETKKVLEEHTIGADKPNPTVMPAAANTWASAAKPVDPVKTLTNQLIALALGTPEFQRK